MEKFLNSETSLISPTSIVTIFNPKKTPRKGNPDHVPLAWGRAEVAAFTINLPTAFRRGEEPPGRGLGHVPPCSGHVIELFV